MNIHQREKLKNACEKIMTGKCSNPYMTNSAAIDILYEYTSSYFTDGNKRNITIDFEETEDTGTMLYIVNLILKKGKKEQNKYQKLKGKKNEDNE